MLEEKARDLRGLVDTRVNPETDQLVIGREFLPEALLVLLLRRVLHPGQERLDVLRRNRRHEGQTRQAHAVQEAQHGVGDAQ